MCWVRCVKTVLEAGNTVYDPPLGEGVDKIVARVSGPGKLKRNIVKVRKLIYS